MLWPVLLAFTSRGLHTLQPLLWIQGTTRAGHSRLRHLVRSARAHRRAKPRGNEHTGQFVSFPGRTHHPCARRTGLAELFVCICVDARRARPPRSVSFQFHLVCLRCPQHPSASSASAPLVCTPPRPSSSAASQVLYFALRLASWPRTANMVQTPRRCYRGLCCRPSWGHSREQSVQSSVIVLKFASSSMLSVVVC